MKKIYPRGFSAILYYLFFVLCVSYIIISTLLLIITQTKSDVKILTPIFIIFDLSMIYYSYLLYSSIRIIIKIDPKKIIVKGQPIRYKNRIQHSFLLNMDEIKNIWIGYDEFNSKGESFFTLNPRHRYQRFLYYETINGNIYKIWIKHFSKKQIKELLNIK